MCQFCGRIYFNRISIHWIWSNVQWKLEKRRLCGPFPLCMFKEKFGFKKTNSSDVLQTRFKEGDKKNWIHKIKLNISNFGWVQNLNDDARDYVRDLENSIYTSSIHATFNYYMGVLLFLSLLFSLSYSLFVYLSFSFAPASVTFVC